MTERQMVELRHRLHSLNPVLFVHGGCIGADDEADAIAAQIGIHRLVFPQNNVPHKAVNGTVFLDRAVKYAGRVTIAAAKPAPGRNIDIIRAGNYLIACPQQKREVIRSGTWMTIRHARRILGEHNVEIIYP
jgi:hypothetical protein